MSTPIETRAYRGDQREAAADDDDGPLFDLCFADAPGRFRRHTPKRSEATRVGTGRVTRVSFAR